MDLKRSFIGAFVFILAVTAAILVQTYRPGSTLGKPMLHLSFSPYGAAGSGFGLKKPTKAASDTSQNAAVIFCVSQVKFFVETENPEQAEDALFVPRRIPLSPLGSELDFVTLSPRHYQQSKVTLKGNNCGGQSAVVWNSHGVFSTKESITLRFDGDKTVDNSTQEMHFQVEEIIKALMTVTNDFEIKIKIENVVGRFE